MTAAPFTPAAPVSARSLPLLLAPLGQLSGDGQLRELIEERRDRKGPDVELWYVEPALVDGLNLRQALSNPPEQGRPTGQPGELTAQPLEAIVAGDSAVITWLQLRFGGSTGATILSPTLLHERAGGLPPKAPQAAVEPRPASSAVA
jgi:hypothetical protein